VDIRHTLARLAASRQGKLADLGGRGSKATRPQLPVGKVGKRILDNLGEMEMVKHLYTFPTVYSPIPRKCYVCNGLLQNGKCKLFRRQFVKPYTISARLCASLSYSRLSKTAHHTTNCAKTLYNFGHERKRSGEDLAGALFSVQDFPGVVRGIGNGFQFSGFRFGITTSIASWLRSSEPKTAEQLREKFWLAFLSSRRTPGIAWPARQWDCRNVDMELSWTTYGTTAL
jgi:hypothetical protein